MRKMCHDFRFTLTLKGTHSQKVCISMSSSVEEDYFMQKEIASLAVQNPVYYKFSTPILVDFFNLVKRATPARVGNNEEADLEVQLMMQPYTRPGLLFRD